MADTDFHMINSPLSATENLRGDETGNRSVKSDMTQSQIIEKPEVHSINVKTISLKEITELVNKQTLKGYRAGYEDGYADGTHINDFFTFGYGLSFGLSLAGAIIMIMKQ